MPTSIQKQFQTLFSGNINFSRDIHRGDRFSVIYDNNTIEGKTVSPSNIIIARLTHNKKTYFAIRYSTKKRNVGFYNEKGESLESRFLFYPLKFKRISSHFSLRRLDPITHTIRPHYGVDLAAPTGTPIHSVGSGKIIFKGWSRGYGNTIKIRYDKHRVGLYAHLSRYASIQKNQWVKRGQLIGFVGQSGWATGPHLHFGWYVDNKPKDPLKRKNQTYPPIPSRQMARFTEHKNQLIKKLSILTQENELERHA